MRTVRPVSSAKIPIRATLIPKNRDPIATSAENVRDAMTKAESEA